MKPKDELVNFCSYTSKQFKKEYKRLCNNNESKRLHYLVFHQIHKTILEGNVHYFQKVSKLLADILDVEGQEAVRTSFDNTDNPLRTTNLIILACKHNQVEILDYVFNSESKILSDLSTGIGRNAVLPHDKDGICRNAFYYAMRSGNLKLLTTLINKWPGDYFSTHSNELDEIVSTAYEEMKLKNLPLAADIEMFLEDELINLRFFSNSTGKAQIIKNNIHNIKERVALVIDNIKVLTEEYLHRKEVDGRFFFITKFIAQNIHVLKRQLKSTYDILPWEEIEFCVICFVTSRLSRQESNIFYHAVLGKNKLLSHLVNFGKVLENERNVFQDIEISKLGELPKVKREEVILEIIKKYPQFKDLYEDYKEIRDICSLGKISKYIEVALSADPTERLGQLVIMRVLQVIGECIKNTLESPKVSNMTSELLLLLLPKNTRKVIINLRNSLSHVFLLSKRTQIEENVNANFYIGVQNDLRKLGDVIARILHKKRIRTIRILLKKIVDCENVYEIKEIAMELSNYVFPDMSGNFDTIEYEKLEKLLKDLNDMLVDKTELEKQLFQKINNIVNVLKKESQNNRIDYMIGCGSLLSFRFILSYKSIDHNSIRVLKFTANNVLIKIAPKIQAYNLKEIGGLVVEILRSTETRVHNNNNRDEVCRLFSEIFLIAEYLTDSIKWIEGLKEKFNEKPTEPNITEGEKFNNQLSEKVLELKNFLSFEELLVDWDVQKLCLYKQNKKLQAAVEMLVLDIMSILGGPRNYLENNLLFVDECTPVLTGRSLRNHLAHDNIIVDIVLSDPSLAVLMNARKLTTVNVMKITKKIGKFIRDTPSKVKAKYNCNLLTVNNQERLFATLEGGNVEDVELCLKAGADILGRSWESWTTLHFAAKGPSLKIAKLVVEKGVDVKKRDLNGQNALHISAGYGRASIVKFLVEEVGLSTDCIDTHGRTPLHFAAQNGHKETVQILLKNNANPTVRDVPGYSALHYAVQNNHSDVVHVMMDRKVHVDRIEVRGGFTCLHIAAERGHLQLVKYFLEKGANVNAQTDQEATPLHLSALNGHVEIVEALILKGANVNVKAFDGGTPLHNAVENGHESIADMLIKHGADVNAVYKLCNTTPLYFATRNGHVRIVNILLKNKANAGIATADGLTPLHFAARHGHMETVKALLKHGVYIHAKDRSNGTPLHHAAATGHADITNLLVTSGVSVNIKADSGIAPLHLAVINGYKDTVDVLIKHNAKIDAQDFNGNTPLHCAAMHGRQGIIDILVLNGSQVNCKNNHDLTPLHLATVASQMNPLMKNEVGGRGNDCSIPFSNLVETYLTDAVVSILKNPNLFAAAHFDVIPLYPDQKCYRDTVASLIHNHADVNARADRNITPLLTAVIGGDKDIVCDLIHNGAEVNPSSPAYYTPIQEAVESGHAEILEILISHKADIRLNTDDKSLLISAVKSNQKEIVKILIANGADVEAFGGEPLTIAVFAGYRDIVELLLKNKAPINARPTENTTPLHVAAMRGHTSIIKSLLRVGAEVNAETKHSATPLYLAAEGGYEEIVEMLVANGADVNIKTNEGLTPLHIAAVNGNCGVLRILFDNAADVLLRDHKNRTALEFAIFHGHLEAVKLFFKYKEVDANTKGNDDWTLLHTAAQRGNLLMIKHLIHEGADFNARNTQGSKPIHIAAREGHCEPVEFFLGKGISIDDRGAAYQTLLHYAAIQGKPEVVSYLIALGADVNIQDANGSTPLHIAAKTGDRNVFDILLNNGAVYSVVDKFQRKPSEVASKEDIISQLALIDKLFEAVKRDSSLEVEKFIKAGAFVNAKNIDSKTPLYYAVWKGYEAVVDTLLRHKANPNVVDSKGITPLHYAAKFSHFKMVKALLANGAIYNATSLSGKTPLDLTSDQNIVNILKLVDESFRKIENGNPQVINDLNKIKDLETVKLIMKACSKENRTLIVAAAHSNFPKVEELKWISQGDVVFQTHMALDLADKGKYTEALSILQSVFEKRKSILGPDNPGALDIQTHIAEVLYKQGNYQEALNMGEEILEKQREMLTANHKDILNTRILIARIFYRQDEIEKAHEIYKDVYEKQKETLGPDHPDILETQFLMALVLEKLNRYEEALKINKAVFKIRKEILGSNNPATVAAQNNIALVLASQGQHEESLKLYREVLEKKKAVLGINHTDTLRTLHNIAAVLMSQQKHQEAVLAYEEVLDIQLKALGPNHPETLNTQLNIGNVFSVEGKWIRALKAYKKCFNQMQATFGLTHPRVLCLSKMIEMINLQYQLRGNSPGEILQFLQKDINIASDCGDIQTVRRLLEGGADVNDQDIDGRTPLHFAANSGQIAVVNILLKYGADATKATHKGNIPLHTAASKGYKEIVEALLQGVSADKVNDIINAKTTLGGATPLHVAAKNGFLDIVKYLLSRGAIYNTENKEGKTPLDLSKQESVTRFLRLVHTAFEKVEVGDTGIIKELEILKPHERVIVTNARGNESRTLLQVAITNKHTSISRNLIEMLKR